MEIHLGAAHCIDPLAEGLDATVDAMLGGTAGLRPEVIDGAPLHVGRIPRVNEDPSLSLPLQWALRCAKTSREQLTRDVVNEPRCAVILSTTKGDLGPLERGDGAGSVLPVLAAAFAARAGLSRSPVVISNACASGTSAMIFAAGMIHNGRADHALVIGVDALSRFVVSGFRSLFALASGPCRPYDLARDGICLGEAAASVVLSRDRSIFRDPLGTYLGGAIANDANHISGPSRTGEGLMRAVNGALRNAACDADDISLINAHGTGTEYNDAMEAIAFGRCGMEAIPLSSYKGSFGHTLGAAGVLESVIALRALQRGSLLRSEGTRTVGLPSPLNVTLDHASAKGDVILKTNSGFGGVNAALILRAWKT